MTVQKKFIQQLQLYIFNMQRFTRPMADGNLSAEQHKELLALLHQVSGLCLTFNLSEEGDIARLVEKRLRDIFNKGHAEDFRQGVVLLKNLISACEEGIETTIKSLQNNDADSSTKDKNMLPKHNSVNTRPEPQKLFHILVVDDDPVILMLAERKLKLRGYKITTAKNGALAVKLTKSIMPDLVLMDGSMPNMGGMEAAEILKDDPATKDIPIFLLTAYEVSDLNEGCRDYLIDEYIKKPFNVDEIVSLIDAYRAAAAEKESL
ncbi:MAG: two-component system cell cycle response regulator DivK [Alphaproteobacteria bacterium]